MTDGFGRIDLISDNPLDYELATLVAAKLQVGLNAFLDLSRYVTNLVERPWIIARAELKDGYGADLMHKLRSESLGIPVIFLMDTEAISASGRIQRFGFHHVVQTPITADDLEVLMRNIAPEIAAMTGLVQSTLDAHRTLKGLDAYERTILEAAVNGVPNKIAALRSEVSLRTWERHRYQLMKKLKVTSSEEMTVIAVRGQYASILMPLRCGSSSEAGKNW